VSTGFDSELAPDDEGKLWKEGKAALDRGNDDRAIELFRILAERGDWRASVSLGYIFEARGKRDSSNYIVAAHWYSRSLSQEERPEGHLALARYQYFGLGGNRDFTGAFEHLLQVPLDRDPQVALMLGELYFLGLGVPRDLRKARAMFTWLAEAGLPIGFLNIFRLETAEGHLLRRWVAYFRGLWLGVRIVAKHGNRDHPLLVGLGRKGGNFRLDRLASDRPVK
jgi:TPR repeat protein